MGAWFKSSWYGGSYHNSSWYGGSGGGGAAVSTGGGGSVVYLGPPPGWREVTEKELRRSAERAHARERDKRLARLREGLRRDGAAPAPEAPTRRESFSGLDAVLAGHDGPVDALARMLAKLDEERDREARALAGTERRTTLGKGALVRRGVVTGFGERRARIDALPLTR